jgi:hypothetical protein
MSFKFKEGGIPKEWFQYNLNSPLNKPSFGERPNPYLKNMQKGLIQPDLTAYSRGNVGSKK